jgi:SAM-dependent methyltransferase
MRTALLYGLFPLLLFTACSTAHEATGAPAGLRAPDVRFEPSPHEVVEAMMGLARVGAADVVYDLGCGDGRIVIAAARRGARGVCVDIDPQRIAESRRNAQAAGVSERIRFLNQDLLTTDLADATVVMLFLSSAMNARLQPKLPAELRPGTRVVSHWHDMPGWQSEQTIVVRSGGTDHVIYLWTMPPRLRADAGPRSGPGGSGGP